MKASKRPTRLLILFVGIAVLLLPAARCNRTNSTAIQGSSPQGSGPSSGIAVKNGAGVAWSTGSASLGSVSAGVLNMINGHRLGLGLNPLSAHDGMGLVAFNHTADMGTRNFLSIVNPDGVDLYQRMVSSTPRIDFDNAWAFVVRVPARAADVIFLALLDNSVTRTIMENPRTTHYVSTIGVPPAAVTDGTIIFAQNVRP